MVAVVHQRAQSYQIAYHLLGVSCVRLSTLQLTNVLGQCFTAVVTLDAAFPIPWIRHDTYRLFDMIMQYENVETQVA